MTVGGWIEMGATLGVQGLEFYSGFVEDYLGLKAEAMYVAGRTREALETIKEAEALGDRYEERNWRAEPHSLCGVFLAALGAKEAQIEASFCEAIRIAREQKSIFLEKRAKGAAVLMITRHNLAFRLVMLFVYPRK